jgi:hypothetical protein
MALAPEHRRPDPTAPYAFAAIEQIADGDWDHWLVTLKLAIDNRMQSPEFKAWVLSAAEIRAGESPAVPTTKEPR